VPFGYKIGWFAVSATGTDDIIRAFRLRDPVPCAWEAGVTPAYQDQVFITPPVGSWVLVPARHWLRQLGWETGRVVTPLLQALSKRLGQVQFFATYRVDDYHLWAQAHTGRVVRGFCHYQGETVWEVGPPTAAELEVGPFDGDNCPNEESVMQVAARWSVNPCELGRLSGGGGVGLLCSPPDPFWPDRADSKAAP
jgi:hypothetical protein